MRNSLRNLFAAAALLLAASVAAHAQVAVQQSGTRLDACTQVANGNGAVNTQQSATATPPAGQYVYICEIDFEMCNDGTGDTAAAPTLTVAATNMPAAFRWQFAVTASTGVCQNVAIPFPKPIKSSAPGTAVTIQSPAATAHRAPNLNVVWYPAP